MPNSILNELSGLLWRERDVLDQILVRLDGEGEPDDVESNGLLDSIASLEVHRAITSREVALEMGLDGEPTLQDLIAQAPREWAEALADHRRALLGLSEELRAQLRPVAARSDSNVVTLPARGRGLQRSLRDFIA